MRAKVVRPWPHAGLEKEQWRFGRVALGMPGLNRIEHRLDNETLECRAVVETPEGSRSKFNYDAQTGLFRLAAVLPAGMAFPLSFGFVPGTLAEDGDPVDILVLSEEPLPVGTLVEVRLLGVIEAEQTQDGNTVRNDRLLAKVAQSHAWADIDSAEQLGEAFARDLTHFFETFNRLRGRTFRLKALAGPETAAALIADAARAKNLAREKRVRLVSDLKGIGYLTSTGSVILLGGVSWKSASGDPAMLACLVLGMALSVAGMTLRWRSHRLDQLEKDRTRDRDVRWRD